MAMSERFAVDQLCRNLFLTFPSLEDGYMDVEEVLSHKNFHKYSREEFLRLVKSSSSYHVKEAVRGQLFVRAGKIQDRSVGNVNRVIEDKNDYETIDQCSERLAERIKRVVEEKNNNYNVIDDFSRSLLLTFPSLKESYMTVEEVLRHQNFNKYSKEEFLTSVNSSSKFHLRRHDEKGTFFIKYGINQGQHRYVGSFHHSTRFSEGEWCVCPTVVYSLEIIDEEDKHNVGLSIGLSMILRHNYKQMNVFDDEGFLPLDKVLNHPCLVDNGISQKDVEKLVKEAEILRHTIKTDDSGQCLIRTNFGHSNGAFDKMRKIQPSDHIREVVKGIRIDELKFIKTQGLGNMQHMSLAKVLHEEDENGVINPPMFPFFEALIYIDVKQAMADGISFFRTPSNYIVTYGDEEGILGPKYFKSVKNLVNDEPLSLSFNKLLQL